MTVITQTITTLPTAPNPSAPSTFNTLAYPFTVAIAAMGVELNTLSGQVNTVSGEVNTNATNAAASASTATSASTSATASATSATASASSATASATSAAASYDSFDDRYLGAKTSDPTLDNDGNALITGALYFNSVAGEMRAYSGAAWLAAYLPAAGYAVLSANTFTGAQEWATGIAIASASTINLDTATGNRVHITGTTAITAVTLTRGPRTVIFDGILTLTHHATTNNLPGAANITTAAGDRAIYESDATTVYCVSYIRANGAVVGTVDGTNAIGFKNLPAVGTKTASYTLAVGDIGKYVQLGASGAIVIPDATFSEGNAITLFNNTASTSTITCSITTAYIAGTFTDKATMTLAAAGVATILFISGTTCVVAGNVT
jgi:hypothetical protein